MLETDKNPLNLFLERLAKVGCRCEAEQMRSGEFCDTCKLVAKINEFTLDLFKRAAQGRTSFI